MTATFDAAHPQICVGRHKIITNVRHSVPAFYYDKQTNEHSMI
jgi:hypothetical protein